MSRFLSILFVNGCFAIMNNGGIPYVISNPSPNGKFETDFNNDPYFDVYSEVRTRYSQVYWTRNPPTALPADIIERFNGKVMAITGYEVDQVFRTPRGDESVPIYWAYNHHYFGWLLGDDAEMIKLDKPVTSQPNPTYWSVQDKPHTHNYPTNIVFKENPGGEFRKSYHGYPKGYAQLLHSPKQFVCEPMQIDIHNREYNGTGYKQWFLPKIVSNSNETDLNNGLSPLIECPCTDRISKVKMNTFSILISSMCQSSIPTNEDCFADAKSIISRIASTSVVKNDTLPAGCVLIPRGAEQYDVVFNTANSSVQCGPSDHLAQPQAGSVTTPQAAVTVAIREKEVTITLSGEDGAWFGVGFGAGSMADTPYAIIVDGRGEVSERRLANHGPGTDLRPSIKVVSSSVLAGTRTVILIRAVDGITPEHYTFSTDPNTIKLIVAQGSTVNISYHKSRTATKLSLIPTTVQSCLCGPREVKYISYMNASLNEYNVYCAPEPRGSMAHQNNAACDLDTYNGGQNCCKHGWFLTDLDQNHLIPESVDTYSIKFRFYYQEYSPAMGGTKASHQHMAHWVFLIDAEVNDYQENPCSDGTMCEGSISAHLTAKEMGLEDIPPQWSGVTPLVIAAHCHAPSCIRQELYNEDTGELLCRVVALYGNGTEPFNERGFEALPPCLFGYQPGLRRPITLKPDTKLMAIKVFNNTFRHLGQMAQWTGLLVFEP